MGYVLGRICNGRAGVGSMGVGTSLDGRTGRGSMSVGTSLGAHATKRNASTVFATFNIEPRGPLSQDVYNDKVSVHLAGTYRNLLDKRVPWVQHI